VFTPLNLVREMLYGLRKSGIQKNEIWGMKDGKLFDDDVNDRVGGIPLEIWRDPNTKWLDPANGIGNFPYVAFHMLDYQLGNHGPPEMKDTAIRRKHIVEKMLYMIEIDKGNVNTSFKIFEQLVSGSKPNICCADTLKLTEADLQRNLGVSKFHVVMGNPPFQASTLEKVGNKTAGHKSLWDIFVKISLKALLPDGRLAFVTQPSWRKPDNEMWKLMTQEHNLEYLHIFGESAVSKLFSVDTRIDMYILAKKNINSSTFIIDEQSNTNLIDVRKWAFLPNYAYADISKIITGKQDGIKIIYNSFYDSRKVKKTQTGDFVHPVIHGITQKGLSLLYTNDATKGHFQVPKVILNKNRNQYPVNDYEGKYGMSELSFGIPITSKEEGDKIVKAINTDRFKEIIKATKWGAFQTDYHMFYYFKPDFYKEFLPEEGGRRLGATRRKSRASSKTSRRK